ncbi:hypothetical protein IFM89_020361 [Coptis chinensis]|uniref:Uncharacterized protein n=1 Tax=Coptis chinensis TaxID=261450 RepID=A0A835HNY9_9MAGN|nr:hypothetical protein IFM89_020361 [Coptis chinensis]
MADQPQNSNPLDSKNLNNYNVVNKLGSSYPGQKTHFPNPREAEIPDAATRREQWRFARVNVVDELRCCTKSDIEVMLLIDAVESNGKGKIGGGYSNLSKVFRTRFLDFVKNQPEGITSYRSHIFNINGGELAMLPMHFLYVKFFAYMVKGNGVMSK